MRSRNTILRAIAAPLAALLLASCSTVGAIQSAGRDDIPVIVIVLDELPLATLVDERGQIDANLFPNFARLQRGSTWFRNATTGATFTHDVMPSILTGTDPSDRLQESTFLPHNMLMMLTGTHDVYTTQPFPRFCPTTICRAMPAAPGDEPLRKEWPAFAAGDRGEKFLSLASSVVDTPRPRLYFAHFILPHQPWSYLPSGRRYHSGELLPGQFDVAGRGKGWTDQWWLTAQAYQRHILQTQFTDTLLGAFLDRLEQREMFDESLLVVTADHGIAFEPGQAKRIATTSTVGQLAAVPLFVKRPFQQGAKISDDPVELTDIAPTIADVLDVPYDWPEVDGRSLFHRKGVSDDRRSVNGIDISDRGRELYEAAALKYRMFSRDGTSIDPYRVGSAAMRRLVGAPVDSFSRLTSTARVEIANLSLLMRAQTGPTLPALLEGRVDTPATEGQLMAVAIDGRLAAFTPTYVEDGQTRFYCMIPPRFLGRGPNSVEVFSVENDRLIALNAA